MTFKMLIKKFIISDRDFQILEVTQHLQRRVQATMMSPPGFGDTDHWVRCPNATPTTRTQSMDKQQDTGELITPFLLRQNKVALTHVPPQKRLSPYGLGED